MSCSTEFHSFIMDQLSGLECIRSIRMMGAYIVYYHDRVACYLCDDKMLYKDVPSAREYLGDCDRIRPYDKAHEMLLVDDVENREFLEGLFRVSLEELEYPRGKRR